MTPPSTVLNTAFEVSKVIQPFYTGGKVALDEDARFLVSTANEDVLILDFETGDELARIEGDGELVTTLSLTPDGSHLTICSRSYTMRIYSLTYIPPTESEALTIKTTVERSVKAHDAPIIVSEADSTGALLATGGAEGLVKVWDIRGGYVTHNFRGHGGVVSALRFFTSVNTDGRSGGWKLASGADDTKIRIWDLIKRQCIVVLDSHVSVVRGLDWSEDGEVLVSGSRDKVICLWDCKNWKLRTTLAVLEEVEAVGFLAPGALEGYDSGKLPGEQIIYMGGQSNKIRLWDSKTRKELTHAFSGTSALGISDIIYHKSQRFLISIHNDQTLLQHTLHIPSIPSQLPVFRHLSGYHEEIIDLAFVTPSSCLLALATNTESIRLVFIDHLNLRYKSFGDVAVLQGHSDIIICLDRDSSGYWLASGAKDNEARLWRIDERNDSFTCYARFTGHTESIGAVALPKTSNTSLMSPPRFLLTGSQDRTIKKWEIPSQAAGKKAISPKALYTRRAHDKDINCIDISPDNSLFATASQDRTVKIWDIQTGDQLGTLKGHRRGVWTVEFGPNTLNASVLGGSSGGKVIITGSGDKTIKLWSLNDYACLKTFEGHSNSVLRTLFLPNGQQIVSSGGDGLLKIWDLKEGECNATLDNHEDKIWALALRPTVYSGNISGSEVNSSPQETWKTQDEGEGEASFYLASGGADGLITIWHDVTLQTLTENLEKQKKKVEQEQRLENYIHLADYRSAITLALQLNHPGRLLSLFTNVINNSPSSNDREGEELGPSSKSPLAAVSAVLTSLPPSHLHTLLLRLRDWNTNARTAPVAQRILHILFRSYPAELFVKMNKRRGAGKQLGGVFKALEVYTEKHFKRIEGMVEQGMLIEFVLREMDGIFPEVNEKDGFEDRISDVH